MPSTHQADGTRRETHTGVATQLYMNSPQLPLDQPSPMPKHNVHVSMAHLQSHDKESAWSPARVAWLLTPAFDPTEL